MLFDERENCFNNNCAPVYFRSAQMVSKSRDIDYFNSMVNKGKLQTFKTTQSFPSFDLFNPLENISFLTQDH